MADQLDEKIGDELRRITARSMIAVKSGKVKDVNEAEGTCQVLLTEDQGAMETKVLLNAITSNTAGIMAVPKVGSIVEVANVDGDDKWTLIRASAYTKVLIKADTVVEFNGGSLGGLVKVVELTNKIRALEEDLNNLKSVLSTWMPVANDGGAALKTALTSAGYMADTFTPTVRGDIENTKIKQG